MYKSVQLHALNHKFPPRKHLGHYVFLGASGFFGGPVDFLIHCPPRASGCHSPMSRPDNARLMWRSLMEYFVLFLSPEPEHLR